MSFGTSRPHSETESICKYHSKDRPCRTFVTKVYNSPAERLMSGPASRNNIAQYHAYYSSSAISAFQPKSHRNLRNHLYTQCHSDAHQNHSDIVYCVSLWDTHFVISLRNNVFLICMKLCKEVIIRLI